MHSTLFQGAVHRASEYMNTSSFVSEYAEDKILIRANMQRAGPQQATARYKTRDLHPEARKHPDGWVAYCPFKRQAEKPVRYVRRDPAQKCTRQKFVFILYRLNRIIFAAYGHKN